MSAQPAEREPGLKQNAIGVAFLALGAVLMVAWRIAGPRGYFERRGFEALPRDFAPGAPAPDLAETPAVKS